MRSLGTVVLLLVHEATPISLSHCLQGERIVQLKYCVIVSRVKVPVVVPQVSAMQVSPSEVLVECHSTGVMLPINSDIHIRGIYVTKVG